MNKVSNESKCSKFSCWDIQLGLNHQFIRKKESNDLHLNSSTNYMFFTFKDNKQIESYMSLIVSLKKMIYFSKSHKYYYLSRYESSFLLSILLVTYVVYKYAARLCNQILALY